MVLDAEQRSALAAIRSLGRAGAKVVAVSADPDAIGGQSKWSSALCPCPSAFAPPSQYGLAIDRLAKEHRADMVMPATEQSIRALLLSELTNPAFALPESSVFFAISDKAEVLRIASDAGIDTPPQTILHDPHPAGVVPNCGFPLVLKPARSIGTSARYGVDYASSSEELSARLDVMPADAFPLLLQRRVNGVGSGVFLFRWRGEIVARFAHRRVREMPASGGASVASKSIALSDAPLREAEELLSRMKWEGLAMIEFKVDHGNGKAYVMEINPRLWGSMQLAIDCGVDFPLLWATAFLGGTPPESSSYAVGRTMRSIVGEFEWMLGLARRSRAELRLPADFPSRWRALAGLCALSPRTGFDTLQFADPVPFLKEFGMWLRAKF